MNTLVEKGFGILIFIGFFLPFTLGLYYSANKGYEFNNVTSELTQMVKEDGEIYGKTLSSDKKKEIYQKEYDAVLASTNDKTRARKAGIDKLNSELKANEDASSSVYNYLNSNSANSSESLSDMGYKMYIEYNGVEYDLNKDSLNKIKFNTGDNVTIKYRYEKELRFGWTPKYSKDVNVTIYKR